jgi:hypothetical protein
MTKNGKIYSKKHQILSKIVIFLSLALHEGRPSKGETFSPKKRTSITSKPEIFLHFFQFCGSLLPSWIRNKCGNHADWFRTRNTALEIKYVCWQIFGKLGLATRLAVLHMYRKVVLQRTNKPHVMAFHASEFVILHRLKNTNQRHCGKYTQKEQKKKAVNPFSPIIL